MPIGSFLDDFPKALFILAHVLFMGVGLWAIQRSRGQQRDVTGPLWLYILSQPVFLAFFGGAITLKMAVLTEQTLLVAMVGWLAFAGRRAAVRA